MASARAQQPSSLAMLSTRSLAGGVLGACLAPPAAGAGLRLHAAAQGGSGAIAGLRGLPLLVRQGAAALVSRPYATANKLRPRFLGKKLKPYSSFKERFKLTGSGKIVYMRPGHVHKRFNKGRASDLGRSQVLQDTYAKTMKRLGFKMRGYN